jgi:hypothetical protein
MTVVVNEKVPAGSELVMAVLATKGILAERPPYLTSKKTSAGLPQTGHLSGMLPSAT